MNEQLIAIAIQNAPAAIALLRGFFVSANPSAPAPTDDEIIAAWNSGFASSIAKDEAWKAAHPK